MQISTVYCNGIESALYANADKSIKCLGRKQTWCHRTRLQSEESDFKLYMRNSTHLCL